MIALEDRIKHIVAYYIHLFGTNNPIDIAEALRIRVLFLPLGKLSGFYKYMEKNRWIIINSDIENRVLVNVIVAHELGHAILHPKENSCFMANHTLLLPSKIEAQANMFAAYLMVQDSLLIEYEDYPISQIAVCTGLPEELIKIKFKNIFT